MNKLTISTDGGSRGNPGPSAIGFVINHQNNLVFQKGEYIGTATNNIAEYTAVIKVLEWLVSNRQKIEKLTQITKEDPLNLEFKLDSNLVVNQLKGLYKIKQPHLKDLALTTHQLLHKLNAIASFAHIYREENHQADLLLNQALDSQLR